jgi:hypothetical protein
MISLPYVIDSDLTSTFPTSKARPDMIAISEWLPSLAASLTFLALGLCKVYGWRKGGVGGGGKPAVCRLQGRCPGWSKEFSFGFMIFLLCIGLLNPGLFFFVLSKHG